MAPEVISLMYEPVWCLGSTFEELWWWCGGLEKVEGGGGGSEILFFGEQKIKSRRFWCVIDTW